MPFVGNLSEFPLPEVLLFIGLRTGRLRLLDVPEFGVLDLDISNGEIQAMRTGANTFIESQKMLDKLGALIQFQGGMFEFRLVPVPMAARPPVLTIHELAIKLVCHVDEQLAREGSAPDAGQSYRLTVPQPEIWVEPELDRFFNAARPLLIPGATLDALARHLQMENGLAHKNLTHLQLLGLIEPINEETSIPSIRAEEPAGRQEELARKSTLYLHTKDLAHKIKKLSSRLPSGKSFPKSAQEAT